VEAGDGSDAIRVLHRHAGTIDVVLLDMTIPGASSRDVLAEVQRVRPSARVIVTSAYSREMMTGSLDASQVSAFIRKPFLLDDLLQLLRETLLVAAQN
jgi:DNA-binding NtrC family response regulator